MDDIKPNQSLDGMQGGGSNTPIGGEPPKSANTGGLNQFNDTDYAPESSNNDYNLGGQQPNAPMVSGGGSGKKLKILVTVFIILFVVATAAAVYFYLQTTKKTTPVAVDVAEIQQKNDALNYDNKTLKTTNAQYQVNIKSLTTTAQQLKTKCGAGCNAIVIPQY